MTKSKRMTAIILAVMMILSVCVFALPVNAEEV